MYLAQEKLKMTKYNHRVIQIEKATFAPLCFSTTRGMGPQAMMFVKTLAKHMIRTNGRSLINTMASIRRRLRFELLKAVHSLLSVGTEASTTRKPSLSRNRTSTL